MSSGRCFKVCTTNLPPFVVLDRCYCILCLIVVAAIYYFFAVVYWRNMIQRLSLMTYILTARNANFKHPTNSASLEAQVLHSGGSNFPSCLSTGEELLNVLISLHKAYGRNVILWNVTDGHLRASLTVFFYYSTNVIYSTIIPFELANELCMFDT